MLLAATAVVAGLPAGCRSVSPEKDYRKAAQVISEHTGVSEVYDPLTDDLVAEKVEQFLVDGLTVDKAISVAMLNNRSFQAQFFKIGASRADVVQSRLLSNPSFSLSLQFPEGGGRSKLNAGFSQELVDLWQIPVRHRIAKAQLEQTVLGVAQNAVELAGDVKVKCYHVLALERVLGVVRENQTLLDKTLQLVQSQLDAGQATQLDVNLARLSVSEAKGELIAVERDHQVAQVELAQVLGLSRWPRPFKLTDTLPALESLPDEGDLLRLAMSQRLDARSMASEVKAADEEYRQQVLKIFPAVAAGLELERPDSRALPGRKIAADTVRESIRNGALTAPTIQSRAERNLEKRQIIDSLLGPSLQITLPIFDQNQAQIAKAHFAADQKRKEYEYLLDTVAAEVSRAARVAASDLALVRFYERQAMPQARESVEGARQLYQSGERNVLVLIEAQRSLIARRKDYEAALRDYAVAVADLQKAVGGRLSDDNGGTPATAPSTTQPENQ